MTIKDVEIGLIQEYENNPRINDDTVKYVARSIEKFGFKVPLVVDRDNVIVTGHTRFRAAQELGLKTVPVIVADDLSEEQIAAFRLADNKVSMYSTWDDEKLEEELQEFADDAEMQMKEFGFEDEKILHEIDENHGSEKKTETEKTFKHKCPKCKFEW